MDALSSVRSELGEGPAWIPSRGEIAWVDIVGGRVHRVPLAGGPVWSDATGPVSAAVVDDEGALVLVTEAGLIRSTGPGGREPLGDVPEWGPERRMNDGAADPVGRLVAGSMCEESTPPRTARLWSLDRGSWRVLLEGVTISNGLAWIDRGETMLYVDTPTGVVDAFDYDVETGSVSGRRQFVDPSDLPGDPDGLCTDSEGGLWLAFWGAGEVRRYEGRRLSHRMAVPAPYTTSVCFAGHDLDHLVITTAAEPHGADAPAGAGLTYVVRPGVRGTPAGTVARRHLPDPG